MKYCVLLGSPRKNGNTVKLVEPFVEELEKAGGECELIWLYDKKIFPCEACRCCQKDWTVFGCKHNDDVQEIFDTILSCDVIVLATPIYSWYCTPPMKALLDRLVYGMNKYYGDEKGPALWVGRHMAVIASCGYRPEKGSDLFEEGMRRYCKHSGLIFDGLYAARDLGYKTVFYDPEKEAAARRFAVQLMEKQN